MNISETFVRKPVLTTLLTASAVLFGVMAYWQLPVNDLPSVDYPVLQVRASYPGASPDTMANTIATPLERQFMQIAGLQLVTSQSGQGVTSLTLQFDLSKDIDAAATDVQTAISQAAGSLPPDLPSPPTLRKTNPNDQAIMYIALTSESLSAGRLYEYGYTNIAQRISTLTGVSRVAVFGTNSAVRIKADPFQLAARGLTMDDLAQGIQKGTSYQGAGQLDGGFRSFLILPQGQLDNAAECNNLIIAYRDGAPIYLRDVATASDTVVDERISMRFKAKGVKPPAATIILAVYRQAGANAVEVSSSIRALVPVIAATLPASVSLTPVHDRATTIVNSVSDVKETLGIAFILVVIVIFLFLGRATDTLIPAVALPLSLLLTFLAMNMLGYSLDNLSLMALTLAVGFLVDDAIVFLENTVRRMERGEPALQATLASAKEISFTILSMTLSLAAVFIPLVFMPGLVGRVFREFSVTIIVSIIASGVVSMTLTPLMCARMLAGRGAHGKSTAMERAAAAVLNPIIAFYGRTLTWFLKHRLIAAAVWVLCLVGTVLFFFAVPKSFLPVGDSSFISGVLIAQEGTSPEQMRVYQRQAEAVIDSNPAVNITFTMAGNAGFFAPNQALLLAFLGEPGERPPITAVTEQIMGGLHTIKGTMGFVRPNPVLEINTGGAARFQGQFAYSVSGIDAEKTYATAEKLMNAFRGYEGMSTVSSDMFMNTPQLEVEILREQASSYGISVQRIETLLRQAFSQNYVYLIKKPEDQYQLILEMKDSARRRPENLGLLYVKSDDGQRQVPLSAVARWKETLGPQSINHINQFPAVTIFFNLKPTVAIGQALEYVNKKAAEIVPPSVRGELLGEAQEFQTTLGHLIILLFMAVFVMYVILGILYESYIHPITVLSSLPVALVGGFATLYLFHAEASLYAFIGVFMLMGIVKKNGIMIIDFALQRVAQGLPSEEAVHEACIDRFRPIVMTTAAALMGVLPIALGFGADGASRQPLGLVIVGGLLVSQLVTLYVTPAIYLYMESFQHNVLDRVPFFRSQHPQSGGPSDSGSSHGGGGGGNALALPVAGHGELAAK